MNPFFRLEISGLEMAFPFQATGHIDTIRPILQGPEDVDNIHPSGARNAYDPDIGWVLQSR